MKTFDLELRVKTFGSIIAWKVLLEDSTNDANVVTDWSQGNGFRFKKLPQFVINDDALEVFAGCRGLVGGTVACEVLINGKSMKDQILAKVEEKEFKKASYKI